MASQTVGTSGQSRWTSSPGRRVWSIRRRTPSAAPPSQVAVRKASSVVPGPAGSATSVVPLLVLFFVVGRLGVDPGVELGVDVPDRPQGLAEVVRLDRRVLAEVTGHLRRDLEQLEVLLAEGQEDLGRGLLRRLVVLVIVV